MLCCWINQSVSVFIRFSFNPDKEDSLIQSLHIYKVTALCFAVEIQCEICQGCDLWITLSLGQKVSENVEKLRTELSFDKKRRQTKKTRFPIHLPIFPIYSCFCFSPMLSFSFLSLNSCQIALGEKDFCFSHLAFNTLLTCGIVLATIMEF